MGWSSPTGWNNDGWSLASAAAAYTAQGIHFDGSGPTTLTKTGSLTGATATKNGIVSVWLKLTSTGTTQRFFTGINSLGLGLQMFALNNGGGFLNLNNAAGANVLNLNTTSNIMAGSWVHLLFSWDNGAGTAWAYNGNTAETTIGNQVNDTIDWGQAGGTSPNYSIGDNGGGSATLNGDIADLYINTAASLDLSVSANRQQFITSGGAPVNLGTDGSTPTGTAPLVYMSGALGSWATNKGTGAGFSAGSGTITAASTNPP